MFLLWGESPEELSDNMVYVHPLLVTHSTGFELYVQQLASLV